MAQEIDYGEVLCEAVDTIIKERLNSISFDRTILCTITDDSLRSQGIYKVSENGKTIFEAYSSDTSYRNNNNVYVQIPGGDWDQQKIIIAKKTTNSIEPFIYQRPFSQLVDITGNLTSNTQEYGLTANAKNEENNPNLEEISIWEYSGEELANYTRVGIQASFRSWLNPFYDDSYGLQRQVNQGEYGLRLDITADNEGKTTIYQLYLNQEDMNGNPYNFDTYFQQEKVVDISALGKITQMELYFYQKQGSFCDNEGIPIPYQDFLKSIAAPNLFVKDIYLSFGYDVNSFQDEMVTIYTLDSKTYAENNNSPKRIQLRWIQKENNGKFKSITENDQLNFELRWYRYSLGANAADAYCGAYWKYLSSQKFENGEYVYEIQDFELNNYNSNNEEKLNPGFFSTWLIPDVLKAEEQIKAIIIHNNNIYRSNNIVRVTNDNDITSQIVADTTSSLTIEFSDNSSGNYRIYNLGNSLIDLSQSRKIRELKPYFRTSNSSSIQELIEAETIEWIIPNQKSMIALNDECYVGSDYHYSDELGYEHILYLGKGENESLLNRNSQKYTIRSYYSQNYNNNTIRCRVIKDGLVYTYKQELIFGQAGTAGSRYTLVLNFDNGVSAVNMNEEENLKNCEQPIVSAHLYDYENNEIDMDGEEYSLTWGWKTKNEDGLNGVIENCKIKYDLIDKLKVSIIPAVEHPKIGVNYYILQATLTNANMPNLTAYLPIPMKSSSGYSDISGPSQILYSTTGEIMDYFKNPYLLYDKDYKIVTDINWYSDLTDKNMLLNYYLLYNGHRQDEKPYTPMVFYSLADGQYYLQPPTAYIKGTNEYLCVTAAKGSTNEEILWSQPILVCQNRYPVAMVNNWDGSLQINENDNTILAAAFIAGSKGVDNKFTGVMVGDLKDTEADDELAARSGIFGFKSGNLSFGFKEDGTGFIGENGKGRINFDGDDSTIMSSSMTILDIGGFGGYGMGLDLDDGIITLKPDIIGIKESLGKEGKTETEINDYVKNFGDIIIDSTSKTTPLKIGDNFSVDWDGTVTAQKGKFIGTIEAVENSIVKYPILDSGAIFKGNFVGETSDYIDDEKDTLFLPTFNKIILKDCYIQPEEAEIDNALKLKVNQDINLVSKMPSLKTETKKVLVLKDGDNIKGDKFEDYELKEITYVVAYDEDGSNITANLITAIETEVKE